MLTSEQIAKQSWWALSRYFAKKCRYFYYRTKESFGHHKRDIVVCRVEETCDSLQDTRDHFEDALQRFREIIQLEEGSLETRYKLIKRQFEISQRKALAVSEKIQAIEEVSEALFAEWEAELLQYTNRSLRAKSRKHLKLTRQHYARLIKVMHLAEGKIKPVLLAFRDQVLFLKHNLNAQAIAALQNELVEITLDIVQLIRAMENSIYEANSFVTSLVEQRALLSPK